MASLVSRSLRSVATKRWAVGSQTVCWYTPEPPGTPTKPDTTTKSTGTQTYTAPDPAASDGSTYKCNEYYEHNNLSFYDMEVTMKADRIVQPSKFTPMPPKP